MEKCGESLARGGRLEDRLPMMSKRGKFTLSKPIRILGSPKVSIEDRVQAVSIPEQDKAYEQKMTSG